MAKYYDYEHAFTIDETELIKAWDKIDEKYQSLKSTKNKHMKSKKTKIAKEKRKDFMKKKNTRQRTTKNVLSRATNISREEQISALQRAGIHNRRNRIFKPTGKRTHKDNTHTQHIGTNYKESLYVDKGTDGYGNKEGDPYRIVSTKKGNALAVHLPEKTIFRMSVKTQKRTDYMKNSYDVSKRRVREYFNTKEHDYLKLR